ncbi:MAG TPA: periplasmic heavy metal sensor [Noviherbaspirillum sp.]|nr:periplasmic heavy metal sensor [Noviherbaspirillum sp.]
MNTTRLKWLLAASLALNAGVIGTVVSDRIAAQPQAQLAQSAPVNLPDYLELTPEQRQRWNDIEQGFLKDIATNWKDIRTHRERLVRQVFSATPDRAGIDAEQAKIASLQDAQQRRVIQQLLAERELLNQQQRAKLMDLLLSRYTQESTEEELLHRH